MWRQEKLKPNSILQDYTVNKVIYILCVNLELGSPLESRTKCLKNFIMIDFWNNVFDIPC